jgi:hypothetical protein
MLLYKLYFQNCITGSPETMDVVLGFTKENGFSSDQVRHCTPSLAGTVSGTAHCHPQQL